MINFLMEHINTVFTSIAGGAAGYLFGRRGQKADDRGKELNNVEKAVDIYQKIKQDLHEEISIQRAECTDRINILQHEIKELRSDLEDCKKHYLNHN